MNEETPKPSSPFLERCRATNRGGMFHCICGADNKRECEHERLKNNGNEEQSRQV